jgi:hypothetical protein
MPRNNIPATVAPEILPIERLLPQPSPDATALVRLVTDPLSPPHPNHEADGGKQPQPTVWILNGPHPLAPEAKIVRMYQREDGGVEVYSSDGMMFVRTVVPSARVRFFDEAMGDQTFIAFIAEAEADEEEDDEDDEDDDDLEPEPPAPGPAEDAPPAPDGGGEVAAT